jgi:diguanylate cyclase (GGDEF)-like protein
MLARCLLDRVPYSSKTMALRCEAPDEGEPFFFRNWWMVPLLTPERIVGILVVDDAFSQREVSHGIQHLLVAISNLTAIAIEKEKLFQEMRSLARLDGLTGLANRRSYQAEVERLLTRARQTGRPLSLIVLDIDHFKQYNDRYGHLAGDDVLRFVARVFRAHARKADTIARYGGEEFTVLLPDATFDQAMRVAEKLVAAVREETARSGEVSRVTISAGVGVSPGGELDANALFASADAALYRAKGEGRDLARGTHPGDGADASS